MKRRQSNWSNQGAFRGGTVPRQVAQETLWEAMRAVTLLSVSIVVENRKKTLTVESFTQGLDRIDSLIHSGEIHKQLLDPDPPRHGHDDEYLVCGILMNWMLVMPQLRPGTDVLRALVAELRTTLTQQGLAGFPVGDQLIERHARTQEDKTKMQQGLRSMHDDLGTDREADSAT